MTSMPPLSSCPSFIPTRPPAPSMASSQRLAGRTCRRSQSQGVILSASATLHYRFYTKCSGCHQPANPGSLTNCHWLKRGPVAEAMSEQRFAAGGGNTPTWARRPGGRTGLERRLDGGGDELRGLRVDDDVPAEQHPADDVAGVAGRVLRVGGHVSPPC